MKSLTAILLPVAVAALSASGAFESPHGVSHSFDVPMYSPVAVNDTVIYPRDGYRLRRAGNFEQEAVADSLLAGQKDYFPEVDSSVRTLSARDTIKVPDSLKFTDPFRYRFYVALKDSLTHRQVSDSLRKSVAIRKKKLDSLGARIDSLDRRKLDSLYVADSTSAAIAAFNAWYASLDKIARKKYDTEQLMKLKLAEADSMRNVAEKKKAEKDSIIENTPRILETFALPDTMQYKQIITWKVDQDFHKLDVSIADTTYNSHYYDYPFRRNDVNSTWLGVAGSPTQYYDVLKRKSQSDVDFYTPQESWSYSASTLPMYNTKTPYTELAYWGTLFADKAFESDNFRVFTTQNITPELNLMLRFERFGGGGILENEETKNKNFVLGGNYLGKKYMMHAAWIHNKVSRGENRGISDDNWVRDTTVNSREIPVNDKNASSTIARHTLFLDQQFRIPFNFIDKIRAKKDTTFIINDSTLNKDITTAFVGHSSEFSDYKRSYKLTSAAASDSMRVITLDNKLFIRLQPWSSEAIVSKLNVGIGDRMRQYHDTVSVSKHTENSVYLYAGAEGQYKKYVFWDAKGQYTLIGNDIGDFNISANARLNLYPFRRDRTSPISISAHFETGLKEPTWYQKHLHTKTLSWDNSFNKISTTEISGRIDIPRWKMNGSVGYMLFANKTFYDSNGMSAQSSTPVSVISASVEKNFAPVRFIHLDNKALLQFSSDQSVIPVPLLALNLRYYFQFVIQRDETKTHNIMEMQIGANVFYNTSWNAPGWNPVSGTFYNQNKFMYENGPVIDAFINIQWKRACIFLKVENVGMGWPLDKADYFSAAHYISTTRSFKIGIWWPFYLQPYKNGKVSTSSSSHSHSEE